MNSGDQLTTVESLRDELYACVDRACGAEQAANQRARAEG
jgi:hypothetical protein